jgi:hypothetical protein
VGRQSVRQDARRLALEARDRGRASRAEGNRRREALAVEVLVAIRERDQADARAGDVVRRMLEQERMSATEVAAWCGGEVSVREVSRLRRRVGSAGLTVGVSSPGAARSSSG